MMKAAKSLATRKSPRLLASLSTVASEALSSAVSPSPSKSKRVIDSTEEEPKAKRSRKQPAALTPVVEENIESKPKRKTTKKSAVDDTIATSGSSESVPRVPHGNKFVGAHVSMAGSIENAVLNAVKIGATAFALDTRSKRKWESPPMDPAKAELFRSYCSKYGFLPTHILPHGSYLINSCSPDSDMLEKSRQAFLDECKRAEMLGIAYYNFHPGSSLGKLSKSECADLVADSINWIHERTSSIVTVIENTAGQGSCIGSTFEELRDIIKGVRDKSRVGVCLDTCHMFAAGYDIRTEEAFKQSMDDFERIVGFRYLKGMHLNDSKSALSSKRDLHEHIGKGHIGTKCFELIMNDPRFNNIPLILETPVDEGKDAWIGQYTEEIALLYSFIAKENQ